MLGWGGGCVDGLLAIVLWLSCVARLLSVMWLKLDGLWFVCDATCVRSIWHAVTTCFAVTVEMDSSEDEGYDEEDAAIC